MNLSLFALPVVAAAADCGCTHLSDEIAALRAEFEAYKRDARPAPSPVQQEAIPTSSSASAPIEAGRRLSGAPSPPTFVSVEARQLHEFPAGHSCGSVGNIMRALPVTSSGGVTYDASPSNVGDSISFVSVDDDWSTTAIQTMPAPFVVTHDAACSAAPSMTLQLNTTVAGDLAVANSLTAGGRDVMLGAARTVEATDPTLMAGAWTLTARNTMTAMTGMAKTVSLGSERTILAYYHISFCIGSASVKYLTCALYVGPNGGTMVEQTNTRAIDGETDVTSNAYGTVNGLLITTLAAGAHEFEVRCRGGGHTFTTADNYQSGSLQIVVL